MRRLTAVIVLGALATLVVLASPTPASGFRDRNCDDFDNQRQAQRFFERNGGPRQDPHGLDGDGDGKACESLPCPCGSGDGGGDRKRGKIQRARVTDVTDGDTIEVRLGGRTESVRLLGIDTPEIFFGEECGGKAASRSMDRMLRRGERSG